MTRLPVFSLILIFAVLLTVSCAGNEENRVAQPADNSGTVQQPDSTSSETGLNQPADLPDSQMDRTVTLTEISKGLSIYINNNCASCHKIGDEGSESGVDLTLVGQRMSFEELTAWIPNPRAVKPDARMPSQDISGEDLEYLALYLSMRK